MRKKNRQLMHTWLAVGYERTSKATLHARLFHLGELNQALTPIGLPQLEQATRFDLADPFPCNAISPRDLIQSPRVTVSQTEAQLDDLSFPRRQRPKDFTDPFLEQ